MEFKALMEQFNLKAEAELAHYGVQGMKWGVRRSNDSTSGVRRSNDSTSGLTKKEPEVAKGAHPDATPKTHESAVDHERAVKALAKSKEKGVSSLSNEEMKQLTNRITAEKAFHQLTTDQKSAMQKAVDEMKLQKEFRQLSAEKALATRSTGRKILDSLLSSASNAASAHAQAYGEKMVKDLMAGMSGTGTDKVVTNAAKTTTKSKPGPFKVNPAKVKFGKYDGSPYDQNNLPDLLKNK